MVIASMYIVAGVVKKEEVRSEGKRVRLHFKNKASVLIVNFKY